MDRRSRVSGSSSINSLAISKAMSRGSDTNKDEGDEDEDEDGKEGEDVPKNEVVLPPALL